MRRWSCGLVLLALENVVLEVSLELVYVQLAEGGVVRLFRTAFFLEGLDVVGKQFLSGFIVVQQEVQEVISSGIIERYFTRVEIILAHGQYV